MKRILFSALALGVALFAAPANAGSERVQLANNDRMPFPALMNALTGRSGRDEPRYQRREVPQARFAEPPRGYRVAPDQRTYEPRWQPVPGQAYRTPSQAPRSAPQLRQPRSAAVQSRGNVIDNRPARVAVAPAARMSDMYLPTTVPYDGGQKAGTIVIDTDQKFLYLVQNDGTARRYGVGVGRPGFEWAGAHTVTRKAEWPSWTPPAEMRKREPHLPARMEGGPNNPLGARALYLGSTLYRIHGTSQPWTIGRAVSSGCIRMRNEDVIDLYNRVGVGTKVIVS